MSKTSAKQKIETLMGWISWVSKQKGYPKAKINTENKKVLTFRQGDFQYYLKNIFVYSHLDPSIGFLFSEANSNQVHQKIMELGIKFLIIPNYPEPSIYNSRIDDLIGNPDFCKLIYLDGGYRIFEVIEKRHLNRVQVFELKEGSKFSISHSLSKVKRILTLNKDSLELTTHRYGFFNAIKKKNVLTAILGTKNFSDLDQEYLNQDFFENKNYLFQTEVEGKGNYSVLIYEYLNGRLDRVTPIGYFINEHGLNKKVSQFFLKAGLQKNVRFAIQSAYPSKIKLKGLRIFEIQDARRNYVLK